MNFLQSEFDEVKITPTGEWRINSPFTTDRNFHLYIQPNKGVFYDHKTQHKGTVFSFIAEYLQIPTNRVIQVLVRDYGAGAEFNYKPEDYIPKAKNLELPPGLHFFSEGGTGPIHNQAYNYLLRRRIPEENIRELGYIYDPQSEYDKSIFIPFVEDGSIVYFITRDFTGRKIKRYKNPLGIDSKQFVFNLDKIKDELFIFEGVMNALSLQGQVGTAMLSAEIGQRQIDKIIDKTPQRIIFVPDNDDTGEQTLSRNIFRLSDKIPKSRRDETSIYIFRMKKFKDFNESGLHHISLDDCERWDRIGEARMKKSLKGIFS